MLRFEGICVDVANEKAAAIIGKDYPYEAWAGHFYHSLDHDRFVKIGIHAARLGIRLSCLICYELERVLRAYEAIDEVVPIRDRRWVMVHVIEATDDQIVPHEEARGHRHGDAQLHVHGERPVQPARDRGSARFRSAGFSMPGSRCRCRRTTCPTRCCGRCGKPSRAGTRTAGRALGESRLGREEALRLITETGPLIGFEEHRKGTLEIGKLAGHGSAGHRSSRLRAGPAQGESASCARSSAAARRTARIGTTSARWTGPRSTDPRRRPAPDAPRRQHRGSPSRRTGSAPRPVTGPRLLARTELQSARLSRRATHVEKFGHRSRIAGSPIRVAAWTTHGQLVALVLWDASDDPLRWSGLRPIIYQLR